MQELKFMPFNRTSCLSRNLSRPGENESLLHANRSFAARMDQFTEVSEDPKGRLIRNLRLHLELDPAELATQACISVAQLYEIEQGLSTRFYSSSLRDQAAKRVAKLLNADWDKLENAAFASKPLNKVVQLQWPISIKPASNSRQDEWSELNHPNTTNATTLMKPVALSLSTPCQDQDLSPDQSSLSLAHDQTANTPLVHTGSSYIWRFFTLLLGALLGYGIALWSPYELVWPPHLIWPSSLTWPLEFVWPVKSSWPFSF